MYFSGERVKTLAVYGATPGLKHSKALTWIPQIGKIGLKRAGSRLQQGLIHLDQALCAPRRCYECPIAAIVVNDAGPVRGLLG